MTGAHTTHSFALEPRSAPRAAAPTYFEPTGRSGLPFHFSRASPNSELTLTSSGTVFISALSFADGDYGASSRPRLQPLRTALTLHVLQASTLWDWEFVLTA